MQTKEEMCHCFHHRVHVTCKSPKYPKTEGLVFSSARMYPYEGNHSTEFPRVPQVSRAFGLQAQDAERMFLSQWQREEDIVEYQEGK
ncbi:hypothetical protein PoB_000936700 [Plakobranchus ocellatus]|uniref:Uncharacterized protein n=1 Tax=Plakobranchus ocellatus TaxID=259542 RepID=A0AAV3YJ01_9GAST|nr:hypothetical protein PoB_000936700 [Plakobranchus ocellatus]